MKEEEEVAALGNSMQQELPRPTSSQGHNEQRNLGTKLESEEAAG